MNKMLIIGGSMAGRTVATCNRFEFAIPEQPNLSRYGSKPYIPVPTEIKKEVYSSIFVGNKEVMVFDGCTLEDELLDNYRPSKSIKKMEADNTKMLALLKALRGPGLPNEIINSSSISMQIIKTISEVESDDQD